MESGPARRERQDRVVAVEGARVDATRGGEREPHDDCEVGGPSRVAVDVAESVSAASTPTNRVLDALDAASVLPMSQPQSSGATALGRAAPFTMVLAGIWLVFLVEPVLSQWPRRDEPVVVAAIVASVLFAATYLLAIAAHARRLARLSLEFPLGEAYAYLAVLVMLATVMWIGLDQRGSGAVIFIAVVAALALPTLHALVAVPLVAGAELVFSLGLPGWERDLYTPAIATTAGFVMWGVKQIMARNIDLVLVRAENERLVIEQERNRFSRDLHDILGHSLTVITVKTELARRLLDVDVDRSRAELADLERLARESLADVRRAVQGYRDISLPGEIARARAGLAAAGIEPELPNSADDVPAAHRELFAWAIREGVTNVIRHSGAARCRVHLAADRVRINDDGRGRGTDELVGSGLAGLRERAAASGATVRSGNAAPGGFELEVVVG